MLPADTLAWRVVDGQVQPEYLTAADHPWIGDLIERTAACAGQTRAELAERLAAPGTRDVPPRKLRMVRHVLQRLTRGQRPKHAVDPKEARRVLFRRATPRDIPRADLLAAAAATLGTHPDVLEACLFADLPAEQPVEPLDPLPTTAELVLRTNLALVQGLLKRASRLHVTLSGNARDVVRYAQLRGLICVAMRAAGGVSLELSGPFALFRRTTLYGRAQAELVPRLPWCDRFALEATCHLGGHDATLHLGPHDPVFPSAPPRRFDSQLEARFARDLARHHPEWGLTREPEALDVGGRLMFPDFALWRREQPERRWLVELVGFWTPAYLARKLGDLARCEARDLVVCVDETLACTDDDLPADMPVVWFRKRVDPAAVLAAIAALERPAPAPQTWRLDLRDLFLDWAGRRPAADPAHAALRNLGAGDPVALEARGDYLHVVACGQPIASLSAAGKRRWGPRLGSVRHCRVVDLVERSRDQSHPRYRARLAVDRWRVPLVEAHG